MVCEERVNGRAGSSVHERVKEGVIHRNYKTQSLLAPVPACPRFIIRSAFNLAHVEELASYRNKVSVNFVGSKEVAHRVGICNSRNCTALAWQYFFFFTTEVVRLLDQHLLPSEHVAVSGVSFTSHLGRGCCCHLVRKGQRCCCEYVCKQLGQ